MNSTNITIHSAKITEALLMLKEVNEDIKKLKQMQSNEQENVEQELAFVRYEQLMLASENNLETILAHGHRNLEWFKYNLYKQHIIQTGYTREQITKILPPSQNAIFINKLIGTYLNITTSSFRKFPGDHSLTYGSPYHLKLRTLPHITLCASFCGLQDPKKCVALFHVYKAINDNNDDQYKNLKGRQLFNLVDIQEATPQLHCCPNI